MTLLATLLVLTSAVLVYLLIKSFKKNKELELENIKLESKYSKIIDIDREVEKKKSEIQELNSSIEKLSVDYKTNRSYLERLLNEVSKLEADIEDMSYGFTKPIFSYDTSDEYKDKIITNVNKQKQLVRDGNAYIAKTAWSVNGSEAQGAKMMKEAAKLMLRAFNGECEAHISKVSWNNYETMKNRVFKSFEDINKLNSTNNMEITIEYLNLKQEELRLTYEYAQKKYEEKEEQKRIREQMREEEKALREIEKVQREAEQEEERYQKALLKAKEELSKAKGDEFSKLEAKVHELESKLEAAHIQKERAISQAQLTKSGHVYIISNIGSFGENIFKIGMTRRLEPKERVYELGDASVPFEFDIHGMIYSKDAPALEYNIHRKLENNRVNLIDRRAEFFNCSIDQIQSIVQEMGLQVELTKLAEAREYRESEAIRRKLASEDVESEKAIVFDRLQQFPENI